MSWHLVGVLVVGVPLGGAWLSVSIRPRRRRK